MRATTSCWAVAVGLAMLACGPSGGGREERTRGAEREPADAAEPAYDAASEAGGDFPSEAERTRAMEQRAAALEQEFRAAMAAATSEEERVRAYQEFERGREELNEMSVEGDGDDAYGPPPEP